MIWLQAGACFALWIGYGLWMRGSSDRLRERMRGLARAPRVVLGSAGLLLGLAVLVAGLSAVYALGGVSDGALSPLGWLSVAVIGLVFVHLQVLGAAAMVSLVLDEVTAARGGTSVSQENK